MEMGIGGDIFQAPFQQLKECITDTWFKSTLEFISENDINIDSPMAQLQLWRTGDTFLTADAIEAGMSGKDLAAINRCRMHLKATTLSDITIARPTRLTMDAYDVVFREENPNNSARAYRWPQQPRPPLKDRRIWKQFLCRAYNFDDGHLEVNQRGGEWRRQAASNAEWTYSRKQGYLYQKVSDTQWNKWKQSKRRRSPEGGFIPTMYHDEVIPD